MVTGLDFIKQNSEMDAIPGRIVSMPARDGISTIEKSMQSYWIDHCNGEPHYNTLTSFAGTCNNWGVPESDCENFALSRLNEFNQSDTLRDNPNKISKTVKDVYRAYLVDHGKHKSEPNLRDSYDGNGPVNNRENTEESKKQIHSILTRIQSDCIRYESDIPQPEPIISINGECIASASNLIVIAGTSKGGKTGFMNRILAASLPENNMNVDAFGMTIKHNSAKQAVIHFDNEQAAHNHHRLLKGIISSAGFNSHPDHFISFNLRRYSPEDRLQALKESMAHYSAIHGGIHSVYVDGIADMVNSVNEEEETNRVIREIETLAMLYRCPIITILHYNPNSEKGRGHLGSQLERKCESLLSVTKDKETGLSTIEGKLLRNAGNIPLLQFTYSIDLGRHVSAGEKNRDQERNKKFDMIKSDVMGFFDFGKVRMSYGDLVKMFMDAEAIKERSAKDRVKVCTESGLIRYTDNTKKLLELCGATVQ